MQLRFDPIRVAAAGREVHRVQLDPVQDALVKELADLVASRIPVDVIPLRGLWLQAVRCWQVEHDQPTDVLSRLLPSQRRDAATEISSHFKRLAGEMLTDPAQRPKLDEVLAEAFALYLAKYNRRARVPSGS